MPVMSAEHRIVGMLSVEDLLQFIIIDDGKMQHVGGKRVADAMSTGVITADPVSDIRRVAQVMQKYHLDSVPIADDQDKLILQLHKSGAVIQGNSSYTVRTAYHIVVAGPHQK